MKKIIIAITGASGVIYGIRLLEALKTMRGCETHLILSPSAKVNIKLETDYKVDEIVALADVVHDYKNQAAAISSGSFKTTGMIIAPCSMKTLSSVVNSYSENLITRAADVILKEQRRLILMPRETPMHQGHCKLVYEASKLGAIICPPVPAFYARPKTMDEMINHTVVRVLDLLDIELEEQSINRWTGI
ncbi:flavin prenyltransferase UbiX [Vibrio inusitatus NBRC 102082]|uniref:Flavin prenyltransferase UbiX n=1 Tax=Vibrio inusitatus NBRC 102082 TaxID=1219070 RepID=A0A4Y3HXR1_9VIBR|nr:UbiX family flavin prenyltransferase [Vibrio inusitatus]GEA51500.1 flavin prenyltransferase UbiX [Vibrio inusitatus NBRC 102082]